MAESFTPNAVRQGEAGPNPQEKVLVAWKSPARLFRPRSPQFFTTAITIAVLLSIVFAIAGEWMLIALMAALIFAYYLWSTIPPEPVDHSITNLGIRTANELYRWNEFSRWWAEDKWNQQVLIVETPLRFPPRLHLLLESKSAKDVTKIMTDRLLLDKPALTQLDKASSWLAAKFPLEQSS